MKVIVFGASGKVGSRVVEELLRRDFEVTAFVYGNNPFEGAEKLKTIVGNVKNQDEVEKAISGQEAVISALGSWGTKSKDILSVGISNIMLAMEKEGIDRIVSLTGTDAFLPEEKPNYLRNMSHTLLSLVAKKVMFDGEFHAQKLAESDFRWTIVRSPVMNNNGSADYELNEKPCSPIETINRMSVAKSMVDILEKDLFIKQSPFIHRK